MNRPVNRMPPVHPREILREDFLIVGENIDKYYNDKLRVIRAARPALTKEQGGFKVRRREERKQN